MGDWDKEPERNNESSTLSPREQDRYLPIANVGRIMKKALPANAKISKDAKETMQECVSEFISFVTGEASDKCQREKRKTINGDDLLWAMTTLGFEEYVEPLKVYLSKFREVEGERTGLGRQYEGGSGDQADGSGVNSGNSGGMYGDGMQHVMMMVGMGTSTAHHHQHHHQHQHHQQHQFLHDPHHEHNRANVYGGPGGGGAGSGKPRS